MYDSIDSSEGALISGMELKISRVGNRRFGFAKYVPASYRDLVVARPANDNPGVTLIDNRDLMVVRSDSCDLT